MPDQLRPRPDARGVSNRRKGTVIEMSIMDVSTQSTNGHGEATPAVEVPEPYVPVVGDVARFREGGMIYGRSADMNWAVVVRTVTPMDGENIVRRVRVWLPTETDGSAGLVDVLELSRFAGAIPAEEWTDAHRAAVIGGMISEARVSREDADLRQQRITSTIELLDAANRARQEAEGRADTAAGDLESFRRRVRAEAFRVKDQQGWCDDGTNETLRNLGLPEMEIGFKARVRVTQYVDVEVRSTRDVRQALNWVRQSVKLSGGVESTDSDVEIVSDDEPCEVVADVSDFSRIDPDVDPDD